MTNSLTASPLANKILSCKSFTKVDQEPIWCWEIQKWKGSIIRDRLSATDKSYQGCSYYDFSGLKVALIDEVRPLIIAGLQYDLRPIKALIRDVMGTELSTGDLILIGKSKNRSLFIMSVNRLLPITQLLGGNGLGEIPINFVLEVLSASGGSGKTDTSRVGRADTFGPSYWTYNGHSIIDHIPSMRIGSSNKNQENVNDMVDQYVMQEGSDPINHPYTYFDLETNECFTLPSSILRRFETEIEKYISDFIEGKDKINKFLNKKPEMITPKKEQTAKERPQKKPTSSNVVVIKRKINITLKVPNNIPIEDVV